MYRMWKRMRVLLPAALVLGTIAGCGSGNPKTIPVEGTVTLDGQPVEGAAVTFSPAEGGRPATGTTDASGKFKLTTFEAADGALPGQHTVTVLKMETSGQGGDPESEGLMGDPMAGAAETKHIVPQRYSDPKSSGLTVTVEQGMQAVSLALTSSGAPAESSEPPAGPESDTE